MKVKHLQPNVILLIVVDPSIKIVSAIAFIVGGLIFLAYSLGRFMVVSKKQMQALASSALLGIITFLILDVQEVTVISNVILTILVIGAALLGGFLVYVKGIVRAGDFGLGGLFGYVVGILIAQFLVSSILNTLLARYCFLGAFSLIGGYFIMSHPIDKWLIISSLIVGAFSLVYGINFNRTGLFRVQV